VTTPLIQRLGDLVLAAGRELLAMRGSKATQGKWHGTQLKTLADETMHRFLSEGLTRIEPGIPVISEEDSASHVADRPSRYWLIDPIDGTASFSAGFDGFVTQAALMEHARPVLAAVYAPALDLFYRAEAGGGACVNGAKLSVRSGQVSRIMVDNYPEPRGLVKAMYDALECTGYMESGSIALKICRVADATADIFFKAVTVRDWDVAPAQLVLAEAGGILTGVNGEPFPYHGDFEKHGLVAASSPELQRLTVSLLRSESIRNRSPAA